MRIVTDGAVDGPGSRAGDVKTVNQIQGLSIRDVVERVSDVIPGAECRREGQYELGTGAAGTTHDGAQSARLIKHDERVRSARTRRLSHENLRAARGTEIEPAVDRHIRRMERS